MGKSLNPDEFDSQFVYQFKYGEFFGTSASPVGIPYMGKKKLKKVFIEKEMFFIVQNCDPLSPRLHYRGIWSLPKSKEKIDQFETLYWRKNGVDDDDGFVTTTNTGIKVGFAYENADETAEFICVVLATSI